MIFCFHVDFQGVFFFGACGFKPSIYHEHPYLAKTDNEPGNKSWIMKDLKKSSQVIKIYRNTIQTPEPILPTKKQEVGKGV